MSMFRSTATKMRKKGLLALLAATAQLAISLSPLAAVPAANATLGAGAFPCTSDLYQVSSGGTDLNALPEGLYKYDLNTRTFALNLDLTNYGLNAAGRNPVDGKIYAYGSVGNDTHLYAISKSGSDSATIEDRGIVSGTVGTTGGDFLPNEANVMLTVDSQNNGFTKVNVSTRVSTSYSVANSSSWGAADLTVTADGTQAFGLKGVTLNILSLTGSPAVTTKAVSTTGVTHVPTSSQSFGAAYSDAAGDLFFYSNLKNGVGGYMYKIAASELSQTSPQLVEFGAYSGLQGPNDGASCANSASPEAPVVTTDAASSPTDTGATLNGTITTQSVSGANVTANSLVICYSTSATATQGLLADTAHCFNTSPSTMATGQTNQALSLGVTGLTAGTTYYFQAKATDANGLVGFGEILSFTTTGGASVQSTYTVTFHGSGSNGGSMSPQTAGTSTALTANAFTKTGYTFAYWSFTNGGSSNDLANQDDYGFASDIDLYAVWTANAPSNIPAAPSITIPSASTVGTTPVTLTPNVSAPAGIGERCLVDPADNVCKQSVTLPGKGTFVLNSNGTVTFTAVLGWTGTATVQYRVTDGRGRSAEAPVTVTVTAPPAPSVTGGTGTTITTVPANVTPQVNGVGSICLVDPADNVCKQTVTVPGQGTFVLNSNGTVTFTAVPGFIGTATVQLQITTAYGQVARGPVSFIVGRNSELQTGATTGTAPVTLAPNSKPDPGSACLIDPADQGCKNTVTVPSVGTWNLNPKTGAVTFKAVQGYVGSTIVQYRVKRAGFDPTFTPFVVTVAKKRPPVTVTIGGFNPGSPVLTKSIKAQITAFMKAYVGYKTIECIGFTMGPTVLKVDKWLSTTRASNACGYISSALNSKVKVLPLKNKMETDLGSHIRRITLTLRD